LGIIQLAGVLKTRQSKSCEVKNKTVPGDVIKVHVGGACKSKFKKKLVKSYIWIIALCGAET
jgi:hypothetical protein